jgi:hypothetical protein
LPPVVLAGLLTYVGYKGYKIEYDVVFHPLAEFPGPPLAAITTYWKAYVECIANRTFGTNL